MNLSIRAALALAILLLMAPHAQAHDSWISQQRLTDPVTGEWCCNHVDCFPTKVSEVAGGYVAEGDFVPSERIIWRSPDGQWWRCRYLSGEKFNKTRCLIGPPPNS